MIGSALTALAVDFLIGEPPARAHPTVWMGHWIRIGSARRRSTSSAGAFVEGVAVIVGGLLLSAGAALAVDRLLDRLPRVPRLVGRGMALKPAMAVRALLAAARDVEHALRRRELVEARRLLSRHLVSRNTAQLTPHEVAAAAIESLAENFNDALVAPLVAFRVARLAGAYAHRFVNTADAMLGYHTEELEWFGKAAARLDDVLGIVPARLSGLLIAAAATALGYSGASAIVTMIRDENVTQSPNAGWPMAAMAGALGVRLEKRDHYRLNAGGRVPTPENIAAARGIVLAASVVAAVMADTL